jgi:elongation factor P
MPTIPMTQNTERFDKNKKIDTTMMLRGFLTFCLVASASAFAPVPAFTRASSALGVAVDTSDIKNGMTIELDGEPHKVLSFSIMKQARGAAKTTIKFKNLMRGTTIENTYRSGEKFQTALIEKTAHQFTYEDGVSSETTTNIFGI